MIVKMTFVQQALLSHAHDLHEKGRIPVKKWVMAGHSMVSGSVNNF